MTIFRPTTHHPNFLLGCFSLLLLLVGVFVHDYGFGVGTYMAAIAIGLGFIHWIWSIVDVTINHHLDERSKAFWNTLVIIVAPVAGIIYYATQGQDVRI